MSRCSIILHGPMICPARLPAGSHGGVDGREGEARCWSGSIPAPVRTGHQRREMPADSEQAQTGQNARSENIRGRGARGDQTCQIDCAAINTNNIALHIEHDGHSVHLTDCA